MIPLMSMARPLRIEYPEAWYHVMNRGRRGEDIFSDDQDYIMFTDLLRETSEIWNVRIAAYCLMPNHYHMLIQTPGANISRGMRHLNGVYTQRYNSRHRCDGQLFRSATNPFWLVRTVTCCRRFDISIEILYRLVLFKTSKHISGAAIEATYPLPKSGIGFTKITYCPCCPKIAKTGYGTIGNGCQLRKMMRSVKKLAVLNGRCV